MENIEVQNCRTFFYGFNWTEEVQLLKEFTDYLNRELVDESTNYLLTEVKQSEIDWNDSIVRYIVEDYIGNDLKPGQQVTLISCQIDASCMSGVCCLVESGDLKVNLCASLLVNYPFELM
jgi:hypothetical protein